jgi:HSP20 family molecular chaperone IbpA
MSTQLECTTGTPNSPAELAEKATSRTVFTPRADIHETETNFVVLCDLPGADEHNIDVTVEKNILSIRATVEFVPAENHSLAYCEYSVGDYERKFALPNEIDRDGITASMKNGVLRLVLPKSANSLMKKVFVQSE